MLMIETINASVFLYLTSLSLISAFSSVIIKPIVALLCRPSKQENDLRTQIGILKQELKTIPMKDEFANYARVQRKINKLEEELNTATSSKTTINFALKAGLILGFQVLIGLIMFISFIWYRHEPLFKFRANFGPMQPILSYPMADSSSVSAHMWIVISCYALRRIIKPLLS